MTPSRAELMTTLTMALSITILMMIVKSPISISLIDLFDGNYPTYSRLLKLEQFADQSGLFV